MTLKFDSSAMRILILVTALNQRSLSMVHCSNSSGKCFCLTLWTYNMVLTVSASQKQTNKKALFHLQKVKYQLKVYWCLKCSVILSRHKAENQEYQTESITVSKLVPKLSISIYSIHLKFKSDIGVTNWSTATSNYYYKNIKHDK